MTRHPCLLPVLSGLLALAGTASARPAPIPATNVPAGSVYVALGSSFAAGPGLAPPNEGGRCMRSRMNYAAQLAAKRKLALIDVSCSGARTEHILGSWGELPAQLDAVTARARLVTMTIGGNDLNYIGGLMAASCREVARRAGTANPTCPSPPAPDEAAWTRVEANLRTIAARVRQQAPLARLIVITYPVVLPEGAPCEASPMTAAQAEAGRAVAARLATLTAKVAQDAGVELLDAAALSKGHDACAASPWMSGYRAADNPFAALRPTSPAPAGAPAPARIVVPYHPNLAGMTAIAAALDSRLAGK